MVLTRHQHDCFSFVNRKVIEARETFVNNTVASYGAIVGSSKPVIGEGYCNLPFVCEFSSIRSPFSDYDSILLREAHGTKKVVVIPWSIGSVAWLSHFIAELYHIAG